MFRLLLLHVTPCVGVWIETRKQTHVARYQLVTPCVGVWIETKIRCTFVQSWEVTPCVGVWIETLNKIYLNNMTKSHPAWVCGLKQAAKESLYWKLVTPCVGVWIETITLYQRLEPELSHPAWVCGLKLLYLVLKFYLKRHTLRGCVD